MPLLGLCWEFDEVIRAKLALGAWQVIRAYPILAAIIGTHFIDEERETGKEAGHRSRPLQSGDMNLGISAKDVLLC